MRVSFYFERFQCLPKWDFGDCHLRFDSVSQHCLIDFFRNPSILFVLLPLHRTIVVFEKIVPKWTECLLFASIDLHQESQSLSFFVPSFKICFSKSFYDFKIFSLQIQIKYTLNRNNNTVLFTHEQQKENAKFKFRIIWRKKSKYI